LKKAVKDSNAFVITFQVLGQC